jgi:argininosuccinate lyase
VIEKAAAHLGVLMPGYTHLQQAQPVLFSHWLMAAFWKLERDRERLEDAADRARVCPLGAGALAGNPFDVDRQGLAQALGFDRPTPNSIDAVNDRDYVVEFLGWAALTQTHLSSLAEDLIIWSTRAFGFVEIDDAYATGSSLMPQKKNPDSLELIRGKTGRVVGHLTGLLTTLKGLPTAYNKDLQEDKEALFDVLDTLKMELPLVTGVIQTLKIDEARMAAALDEAMLATDLADYLVRKGLPFRETHHLVGQVVRRAEDEGVALSQLDLETYQAVSPEFQADVYEVFNFNRSVEARSAEGGTAPKAVGAQIDQARARIRAALRRDEAGTDA